MAEKTNADLLVIGGGPGGYTAAFRAADLGLSVTLLEERERLGGVCLNVGCIPSKTLLHASSVIEDAQKISSYGVKYGKPEIDLDAMRQNKEGVVKKLTDGLELLCSARKIKIVKGSGKFKDSKTVSVEGSSEVSEISFKNCIIAAGSRPVKLPIFPDDPGIWDSSDALEIKEIPEKLLVVGGGIIGLEMATVYNALGSSVTVVEMLDQIIPPADADVVKPLFRKLKKSLEAILLETEIIKAEKTGKTFKVTMKDKKGAEKTADFDRILVAVGRKPNTALVEPEKAGIETDKGFIKVDNTMRTNVDGIYAIGDITGNPMLAHRASHQGRVAAEIISGLKSAFTPITIPSVAYTSPEVAWMGITEKDAARDNIPFKKGVFPWAASGRALSADNALGSTKVLFDPETGRIIGAGIAGYNAGELISEAVLAMEMGCDAEDIGSTIHPHPTLAETIAFASDAAAGTVTDILPPKA
ncbi:MAG: dihydrolipoyl dehydrogenase [Spirochaetia bacterium]|jgi:dihydrolipoamide dehydrogenase|nr:dihydrolipoyl dehydrogenase [Spirochaetia bacterium]